MQSATNAVTMAAQQLPGFDELHKGFTLDGPQTASTPFSGLLKDAIGQVNALESQAQVAVDGLMAGSGVDVHQAMIATQKAGMAFELALSVRNKAIQAYQSVMGMQF